MENIEQPKNKGLDMQSLGIISYLGIIGFIIAFILGKDKNNEVLTFHLRQSAGISALFVGVLLCFFVLIPISIIIPPLWIIVFPLIFIFYIGNLILLILIVMGIMNVVNEKMIHLPVIGKKSEQIFYKYIK